MDPHRLLTAWLVFSTLTVLDAVVGPKFTRSPEPIVAPLGDEVEFECSLDIPAEAIRWNHNGKLLPHAYFNATKSQLIFRVEKDAQVGEYQCVAFYGASALASTPANLTLAHLGPPTEQFRRKLFVTPGNNLLINCSVPDSNPTPGIQYYRDDLPLTAAQILGSGSLLLTNVSKADSGQYSCSATNTYVLESPRLLPSYHILNVVSGNSERRPPQFTFTPPSQYFVQQGFNMTLECAAFGEPVPKVRWRKADGPLKNDRAHIAPGGLQIVDLRLSDQGTYICEISNSVNPPLVHHIELIVQESPVVVKGPEDLEANEFGRATLNCTVRGKPTPTIEWLLNGNPVENNSHVRVNDGKLELGRVEKSQAGWYQCMAKNELGATFAACQLFVVPRQVTFNNSSQSILDTPHKQSSPPHRKKHHKSKSKEMVPPSKPIVTRLTESSVMVRWHVPPNNGLPIVFLKVQHREMVKGGIWQTSNEDIPSHINCFEVINLTPSSEYKFRIAAVYSNNDNMQGSPSAKFRIQENPNPKHTPAAPKLTHLSSAGPNSIKIFWEYNATELSIAGFFVYYRSTSSAGDYIIHAVEDENARSHVISYLQTDFAYDFKLQSFTSSIASDFSEILTQKTDKPATVSPPTDASTPPNSVEVDEGSKGGQQLYVTLGAVIGGLALLLILCTWILCCNKHRQHHSTSTEDDDVDKSRHIQMEAIHMNGHVGGHVAATRDSSSSSMVVSKTSSNGCCSKMNITSNPLDPEESKTQNVMEIAFITTNSCDDNCSSSVLTARLASAAVLPTCAMESESWRRPEIPRPADNYV